jgi:hypothetical protein
MMAVRGPAGKKGYSRRMRRLQPFLLVALFPLAALAQKSAGEVNVRQVFQYQANVERGCKDRGRQHGDPAERVDAFCGCMIKAMRASVPVDAWQKAYFHSVHNEPEEERKALLPHLPNLQECKDERPRPGNN